MTTTLVSPLTESRPRPQRWQAAPLVLVRPGQPALDLWPDVAVTEAVPEPRSSPPLPGLPDARTWSVALATRVLEVLAGRRSPAQLVRWANEDVLAGLGEGPRHPDPVALAARLQSVRLQHPRPGAVEVAVHARSGARSLAWAFRLEAQGDRWLCTALDLGPGGAGSRRGTT